MRLYALLIFIFFRHANSVLARWGGGKLPRGGYLLPAINTCAGGRGNVVNHKLVTGEGENLFILIVFLLA